MTEEQASSNSVLRLPFNDVADCVLLLNKCQAFYILGSVLLRKVCGTLSIDGHNLTDDLWHSACSSGPNLVTLECSSRRRIKRSSDLFSEILDEPTRKAVEDKLKTRNNVGCVVLFKAHRLPSRLQCDHIFDLSSTSDSEEQGLHQKNLRNRTADLGFTLFCKLPKEFTSLIVSPSWKSIPGFIQSHCQDSGSPVVLICGGKNVGKSTFAKYMMNKLLNTQKPLYYLETDVGQSEFTPPGILSLIKIDTPVFGPPFLHLLKPERAFFFGDISPKDRPSTYVQLIYALYQYYSEYCKDVPLIVNTCGWVKGMGIRILLDVIRIVQPSHLIQVNSQSQPTKNPPVITEQFLLSEEGWSYQFNEESSWTCPTHIYQMDAFTDTMETLKGSSVQASELRTLSLLSYFGSSQSNSSVKSVQEYILKHCDVYSRSISSLEIYNICDDIRPSEILNSINGSIVGLVKAETNEAGFTSAIDEALLAGGKIKFGECVGLGIVRNIDTVKRIVYIITPEPLETLKTVNVLMKGRLEIMDALYKKHEMYEDLPYVTSEFTYKHRGSGQKRVRYNLLRHGSPHSPKPKLQKTDVSS